MCPQGGRALTAEQQDIVMSHDSRATDPGRTKSDGEGKEGEPSLLVVTAFAGTGKTTTLRAYAEARPDRKYVHSPSLAVIPDLWSRWLRLKSFISVAWSSQVPVPVLQRISA